MVSQRCYRTRYIHAIVVLIPIDHCLGNVYGRKWFGIIHSVLASLSFQHKEQLSNRIDTELRRILIGTFAQLIDDRLDHRHLIDVCEHGRRPPRIGNAQKF